MIWGVPFQLFTQDFPIEKHVFVRHNQAARHESSAAAARSETSHRSGGYYRTYLDLETKKVLSLMVLERVKNEISAVETLKDAFEKIDSLNDDARAGLTDNIGGIMHRAFSKVDTAVSTHTTPVTLYRLKSVTRRYAEKRSLLSS